MRILFIENHENFAGAVRCLFLNKHDVVIVPSLGATKALLSESNFDAALVDYDLDDCKGDEVIRLMRNSGFNGRIVAVSSHEDGNRKLLAAGADAVCPKMQFSAIEQVLSRT